MRTAAALLGLAEAEVESSYPCRFATIGPWFVLVGVKTLDALQRVKIHPDVYEDIATGGLLCVFVFAKETYNDDADFAARMFLDKGLQEDPATGSANTAFAAYLRSLGVSGEIVVEQGFEIDRPSRLYLEVADTIRVGGNKHVTSRNVKWSPAVSKADSLKRRDADQPARDLRCKTRTGAGGGVGRVRAFIRS